jgi:thiamine-monophosphate kinase
MQLDEFSFINELLGKSPFRRDGFGPGDDGCLILQSDGTHLAVSADASLEGVHYRLDWCSPEVALRKAVRSNLSDINAMGGTTTHLFLSLGLGRDWGLQEARNLGQTLRALAEEHSFLIAGGDTVRAPTGSFFAITVIGTVKGRPLLRSAAQPGHAIYVTGELGGSALGLETLKQGNSEVRLQGAVATHLNPLPPLQLGPALAALSHAIAAIDVSDGLSSELNHLSRQSGCRLVVDWGKLPYDAALVQRDQVLNGGEEYQLLFTGSFSPSEITELNRIVPCHSIGYAEAGEGVYLKTLQGEEALVPGGFRH